MLDTDGWSDRQLQSVLGTRGETVVANWWRGKRLPPAWLALALSALDAGDVVNEPLTPEALRDRMAEQRWGPAGLAAALGVARAAITRWQSGRSSPAAGVTLALAEAERPTPLDARHISGPAVRPADR